MIKNPGPETGVFLCPNALTLVTTRCYTYGMTTKTSHCARCGRALRDPKSIAAGVGPKCAKRMAIVAPAVFSSVTEAQADKAVELIGDAGIQRVSPATFLVVSTDGAVRYETTTASCSCKAGQFGRMCYHRVAARLIAA